MNLVMGYMHINYKARHFKRKKGDLWTRWRRGRTEHCFTFHRLLGTADVLAPGEFWSKDGCSPGASGSTPPVKGRPCPLPTLATKKGGTRLAPDLASSTNVPGQTQGVSISYFSKNKNIKTTFPCFTAAGADPPSCGPSCPPVLAVAVCAPSPADLSVRSNIFPASWQSNHLHARRNTSHGFFYMQTK